MGRRTGLIAAALCAIGVLEFALFSVTAAGLGPLSTSRATPRANDPPRAARAAAPPLEAAPARASMPSVSDRPGSFESAAALARPAATQTPLPDAPGATRQIAATPTATPTFLPRPTLGAQVPYSGAPDPAAVLPGSISGTVTNALGTPVAGAGVWVCCYAGGATSAADGTYTISGIAPGSSRVVAFAAGYAPTFYPGVYNYSAATLVTVTSGVTTPGVNFALAAGARISGVVRSALATPIAGASVLGCPTATSYCGSAVSAADGTYTITDLAPDDYRVRASGSSCPPSPPGGACTDYAPTYYNGTYSYNLASLVRATSGATTPGINFALALAGRITGTVRNAAATPIAGALVRADGATCCISSSATTAPDGTYTITGLAPGSYRVQASGQSCAPSPPGGACVAYAPTYYNGVYDYYSASPVPVTSGATTPGIDFALSPGASISGTVTNAMATPIAGISVNAYTATCCLSGSATTAADGTYTMTGLAPGSYRVWASGSGYVTQYFNGAPDYATATVVTVSPGVTASGINFALVRSGSISGIITNALATPVAGLTVMAQGAACCGSATTAADGTYTITDLVPGSYRVYTLPGPCSPSPPGPCSAYPTTYYTGTYDYNLATLVPVTAGATTPGINFALALAGSVSGTVTNTLATPIAGVLIQASRSVCCGFASALTAADGSYTISGLPPGSFRMDASGGPCAPSPPSGCATYAHTYYNGTYDFSAATLVTVTSGATTPGINFALALGGTITGIVRNASATPIAGASVRAAGTTCCSSGFATTAADGSYAITGLSPGTYRVQAWGSSCVASPPVAICAGYVPQYFAGVDQEAAATLVNVASGGVASGINFALPSPSALHPLPIGLSFNETRDTAGATLQVGEATPCGGIGATVWYKLELAASPPGYPTISVDTVGSNFSTVVAVYAGGPGATPLSGSTLLACKATGTDSGVVFTGLPGTTYFFQVGGQAGATGQLTLNVSWDTSGDGYTALMKQRLGRNPAVYCRIMRGDVNGDGKLNILDLALIATRYNQLVPTAPPRFDQNADGKINIFDLALPGTVYNQNVTACP